MAKAYKVKKTPAPATVNSTDPYPPSSGLQLLFEENIKRLYWVENHLVAASLPKMISAAGNAALKKAFSTHLKLTTGHVKRLETIFGMLNRDILARKSNAMEGLGMDGEQVIGETPAGSAERNAGLIMAGRSVENYEISAYTGLIGLADQLELSDISGILSQTLNEEQEADRMLSVLFERK